MNKKLPGKYMLSVRWLGSIHIEWYRDKARAVLRKEELERYVEEDGSHPFTEVKIKFVTEDDIFHRRY